MFFSTDSESSKQYAGIFSAVAVTFRSTPSVLVGAFNLKYNDLPEGKASPRPQGRGGGARRDRRADGRAAQGIRIKAAPTLAWFPRTSGSLAWLVPPDAITLLPTYDEVWIGRAPFARARGASNACGHSWSTTC